MQVLGRLPSEEEEAGPLAVSNVIRVPAEFSTVLHDCP